MVGKNPSSAIRSRNKSDVWEQVVKKCLYPTEIEAHSHNPGCFTFQTNSLSTEAAPGGQEDPAVHEEESPQVSPSPTLSSCHLSFIQQNLDTPVEVVLFSIAMNFNVFWIR